MLRIGNKKAFSLIEQMVTVAVLSLGIVLIFEAFFASLNAFSYSLRCLDVQRWMDEKIWEMQDELIDSGRLITGEHTGSFVDKNKNFEWKMSLNLIDQVQDSYLCRLTLDVFWKEAQRNIRLSQEAYVQN